MAHIKYRYFAKLAREAGDEATARALQIAIDGETYEYTEMYPGFRQTAEAEGQAAAVAEMDEQIAESKEHAAQFQAALAQATALKITLEKAQKRFAALARVEERHAKHYQNRLAAVVTVAAAA